MILLNDFKRQWEHTSARILSAVASVGESGWYVLGENVAAFEQALAGLWQRRYAIGVASGLDALEISLRVLGCRPGDPVLTTPFSAFATTLAILKIGAVPVFVDTDRCGHIDLALCREVLQRRQDIRFLLPVHLYGNALDLAALKELRAEFHLRVVEDCAQAILASSAGMPTGAAGIPAGTVGMPASSAGSAGTPAGAAGMPASSAGSAGTPAGAVGMLASSAGIPAGAVGMLASSAGAAGAARIPASSAGIPAGAVGQLAATSFYPTKNLGALGDGGAILTDDEQFDGLVRVLRDYGQSGKYQHDEIGYNSRLDELQAAVLNRVYLPELQGWTGRRREIAARYRAELSNERCACLPMPPGSESVHHLFPVLVLEGRKQEFLSYMRSRDILCGEHYPIPIPDQRAMAHAKWEIATPLENTRRIAESEVSLPIHPYLTDEEVGSVIGAVNGWGSPRSRG